MTNCNYLKALKSNPREINRVCLILLISLLATTCAAMPYFSTQIEILNQFPAILQNQRYIPIMINDNIQQILVFIFPFSFFLFLYFCHKAESNEKLAELRRISFGSIMLCFVTYVSTLTNITFWFSLSFLLISLSLFFVILMQLRK
ncbi:MAG: hypothetical protein ACI9IL_000699 [Rickettsiales bacterium]|jgi:hypothetical protein